MKKRLEDSIRDDEAPRDLVLLLRGGEDRKEKLIRRADLLEEAFTYGDRPARGLSLFAASSDLEAWVLLGTQFRTFSKYRRVEAADLARHGLLLPTFAAPHWTLMIQAPDGSEVDEEAFLTELLAILGPALDNPKYQPNRKRRER